MVGLAAAVIVLLVSPASRSLAWQEQEEDTKNPGQFFQVALPVTDEVIDSLRSTVLSYLGRAAAQEGEPTLIFEFPPKDDSEGHSDVWASSRLADFLATDLRSAKRTIAYVPGSLKGFAVLAAMACDEIAMGDDAELGPIPVAEGEVNPIARTTVLELLVNRKGRNADLLLGMLDPQLDLREVLTADRRTHFVLASNLESFRRENQIIRESPAWEGGKRGVLTAERARSLQVANVLASTRARVIQAYNLDASAAGPTASGPLVPLLIQIEGPIDAVKEQYLKRRIAQAVREQRVNLIVFRLNSAGGQVDAAKGVADQIAGLHTLGVRTIAFVDDRALGVSALLALACDEIVVRDAARMGDVTTTVSGGGQLEPIDERTAKLLAHDAEDLARKKLHPEAVARAMVDPTVTLVSATDAQSGALVYLSAEEAELAPERYKLQGTIKPAGSVLTLDSDSAIQLGMSREKAETLESWLKSQGIKDVRTDQPSWVDALVTTLNSSWMSGLLLFVGLFMLILELKLPGVGLPAIISALAFLLFFWSHWLGGTADRLEILLFLAGMVAIALELFVFPGFGIFGVSGILMVLSSVVMASHTFIWPTQEYEYRQMGGTLGRITLTIVAVVTGAILLGRYFPHMPIFRRMILVPEESATGAGIEKPDLDPDGPLTYLLGERGKTTTVCRPSGKARIGDQLVDVTADGFFIEANAPVEVIEVRGSYVLVRKV
jgi:membrane-bound serine protease (ClpP class)